MASHLFKKTATVVSTCCKSKRDASNGSNLDYQGEKKNHFCLSYCCFLVSLSLKADFSLDQLLCVVLDERQVVQLIHDAVLNFSNVGQRRLKRQSIAEFRWISAD